MAKYLYRFFRIYSVILIFFSFNLSAETIATTPDLMFITELDRLQYEKNSEAESKKQEKVYNLLTKAYACYKTEDFTQSLLFLKKAMKVDKKNEDLKSLYQSITRLNELQQSEFDALKVSKDSTKKEQRIDVAKEHEIGENKLDWRIHSDTLIDPNKYLFTFEFRNIFNKIKYDNETNDRFALGGSVDFFFPGKDRTYGIYVGFNSLYVDLNNAKISSDYTIWQYSSAFQWRLSSTFPGVKERLNFIMRFGMLGQQIVNGTNSQLNSNLYSYDVIPWFEASIQDPFFYHKWPSKFTQNLVFKPVLGLAWWPFGDNSNGLIYFGMSMGYRIGYFICSLGYTYRYQVAEDFEDLSFSEVALKFTLQYY